MGSKCKTEVYSRVTGFFQPVQNWNKGKQEEFKGRKEYSFEGKLDESKRSIASQPSVN